jgi:hypothetical protein
LISQNKSKHQKFSKISFYRSNQGISMKITPLNITTVQPIFTTSILIDSTPQAKQNKNVKILKKISFLGSNWGIFEKKLPNNTF